MAAGTRLANLALKFRLLSISPSTYNGVRCASLAAQRRPETREQVCQLAPPPLLHITRTASFFNKLPAEQLWKGVVSVSNAGKKKGRGKGVGKRVAKNLNKGQVIGIGSENIVWPGLNAPVVRGRELVQRHTLPKDEEREAKLIKLRDSLGKFRRLKIDPLDRGWSGTKMGGRSVGPPDPIGEDTFEDFDTRVLEFKIVTCMTAVFGRKRRYSMFVVTGNGNGLSGFALAKASTVPAVMRKAKNLAAQKLLYIPRYNEHTVLHDFYSQFGATKLFVSQKPEGYGLVCHRAIKTVCQAVGIKDLHAKVEGSTNVQNLIKAFFLGLLQQKSHQQLADEKHLHLVEFREENLNFPQVVASPEMAPVRTKEEIPKTEELNVSRYVMDGRVRLVKKRYPPGYVQLPSYQYHLKKYASYRNKSQVQIDMLVHEGEYRSFLTDQYPECRPPMKKENVRALSDM